jgi:predicted nucleotidyltransferase
MNKTLKRFLNENSKINFVFLGEFGSHLYGTNTDESDHDYKGIYLPTKEQCYLNEIPKTISFKTKSDSEDEKNTKEDVDIEVYSLHYYLKLLRKGDTGVLDMLHTPPQNEIKGSKIWDYLQLNRKDFYTTNLSAFVGYCRTQANKYGIKGSRLNDAEKVIYFLFMYTEYDNIRLSDIWDKLPKGEHIHKIEANPEQGIDYPMYQVCGRKLQSTVTVQYAYDVIKKFYDNYGLRAQKAANNEGIDWKAVSHALRCAEEMKQVFEDGTIQFPLKNAEFLLEVKNGLIDYTTVAAPALEEKMELVEQLASESDLPKKVNFKKYEKWLVKIYNSNEWGS